MRHLYFVMAAAMAASLAAAGCGGGGGTTTPPPTDSPIVSMVDEGGGVLRARRADNSVTDYVTAPYQKQGANWVRLTPSPDDRSRYYITIDPTTGKAAPIKLITTPAPLSTETTSLGGVAIEFAYPAGEYNAGHVITVKDGAGTKSGKITLHFSVSAP